MSDIYSFTTAPASIVALIIALFALRAARRGSDAATRAAVVAAEESALRNRPWIGLKRVDPIEVGPYEDPHYILRLNYHNVGALPGHELKFSMTIRPSVSNDTDAIDRTPVEFADNWGGLFPGEPGDRLIGPSIGTLDHGRFQSWRMEKLELEFSGAIMYKSGNDSEATEFHTEFRGILIAYPSATAVIRWANGTMV